MQLTEINLEKQFMTIIKGDFHNMDYVEKTYTFSNKNFERIMAFLTIIQDVYNQKEQLEVNQERLDIARHLNDYLKIYFETYANTDIMEISEYADNWITDEAVDFMPEIIFGDYYYPRTIENIKIIKDGKVYILDENQPEEDIKDAQQYVINWLKNLA